MTHPNVYHRTIVKKQLESAILGKPRDYWVYLPPGYNEVLSYPVVYCQDGVEFLNFGRIATTANQLVLEEDAVPPIIVGVAVDMDNRNEQYDPIGNQFEAYRRFWIEELLPAVEREFPVRTSPSERILAGDSLGGTVSLHLALDRPDLFRNVIALSGAFLNATQEKLRGESDLHGLDIYMVIGLQEDDVKTARGTYDFLTANRVARELLEQRGASVTYIEAEGKHLWGFWQKQLPAALTHYLGGR